MEEKKEKAKKEKERFEVVQVPTNHLPMVRDNEDDTLNEQLAILTKIANDVNELKNSL